MKSGRSVCRLASLVLLSWCAFGCDNNRSVDSVLDFNLGGKPQTRKATSSYDIVWRDGYPYRVDSNNPNGPAVPWTPPGANPQMNPHMNPNMGPGQMGTPVPFPPAPQGIPTPMPNMGTPNMGAPNMGTPNMGMPQMGTWVSFRDPRGRYQCQFPSGKMQQGNAQQSVGGKNYTAYLNGIEENGRAYVVIVTQGVAEPTTREAIDALEAEFAALAVRGAKGKMVRSSKTLTTKDGIPATQVIFTNDARSSSGKCWVFLVDGLCFQVVGMDLNGSQANIEKFLDSLELLGANGNRRPAPKMEFQPHMPQNEFTENFGKPKAKSPPPSEPEIAPSPTSPEPESPRSKIKLKDKNFPAIGTGSEQPLAETPLEVPQPNFPTLPTIPKIKGSGEKPEAEKKKNRSDAEPPPIPKNPGNPVPPQNGPNTPVLVGEKGR